MPWNFPFWQVLRFAVPALLAGNAALLKHSPNVTGCALAIERMFADAGRPKGCSAALVVAEEVAEVAAAIIEDPRVAAVTLTGSERAGRRRRARPPGRAIKKSVLELGGSDPFVVLADADVAAAAERAQVRFLNAGQSCIAAKRVIVHRGRGRRVQPPASSRGQRLHGRRPARRGHGRSARWPARTCSTRLQRQVPSRSPPGARCSAGGERIAGPGLFFAPTVLDDVAPTWRRSTRRPSARSPR